MAVKTKLKNKKSLVDRYIIKTCNVSDVQRMKIENVSKWQQKNGQLL